MTHTYRFVFGSLIAVGFLACGDLESGGLPESDSRTASQSSALTTTVYDDALASGWSAAYSWSSTYNLASTTRAFSGTKSIAWTSTAPWGGLKLFKPGFLTGTGNLTFKIYAATAQKVSVWLEDANNRHLTIKTFTTTAGAWTQKSFTLSELNAVNGRINSIVWEDDSGSGSHNFWIDVVNIDAASQTGCAPTNVQGAVGGQHWTAACSPYNVTGNLSIASGTTLTIDPGVVVNFQGRYKLSSRGTLNSVGTQTKRILFTAANPTTGWNGIRLLSGPPANIQWTTFEYANKVGNQDSEEGSWDGSCGGALYIGNSGPSGMTLDYNIFRFNKVAKWGGAMNLIINNSMNAPIQTFTGNIFYSNASVHDPSNEGMAGAVWLDHIAANTTFLGGAFINNSVADPLGGGAVGTFDSNGSLTRVLASGNTPNLFYNSDPNASVVAIETPYSPSQSAATPTFALSGTNLTISCSTPNSTVFYTLDGTTPNYGSRIFANVVGVSSGATVKAICQASQANNSQVATYSVP